MNAPCAVGQECMGGMCQCTPNSCPKGCCQANACVVPNANACGLAGMPCVACLAPPADSCNAGMCGCGNGPPCPIGQECQMGKCACTPQSCANGCCDGNGACLQNVNACGINGNACMPCPMGTMCVNGACLGMFVKCVQMEQLCLGNNVCGMGCGGCLIAGKASALCPDQTCVSLCNPDCPTAIHTCVDAKTMAISCVPDCMLCVGICT
jgi:hypothetical protein